MNKFKIRLAFVSFFGLFFFRLGIFLLLGIVLMVIGLRIRTCFAIGIALIAFDFIASVIETVKMFRTMRMSDHPVISDVYKAINTDDPYGEMDKVIDGLNSDPDVAGGKFAVAIMNSWVSKTEKTVPSCVEKFESLCHDPMPGEVLSLEYGPVSDEAGKYSLCLMKEYPVTGGHHVRLFMAMIFRQTDDISSLKGSFDSNSIEGDFFACVRDSEIYKRLSSEKILDVRNGFEQ